MGCLDEKQQVLMKKNNESTCSETPQGSWSLDQVSQFRCRTSTLSIKTCSVGFKLAWTVPFGSLQLN